VQTKVDVLRAKLLQVKLGRQYNIEELKSQLLGKNLNKEKLNVEPILKNLKRITFPIKAEKFEEVQDTYFLKKMLIPYLSSVFFGLIEHGTKDYLTIFKTRQYLNLPEPLGDRVCNIINANGDERIDHDEFIEFFTVALMGNL
jgi:hypothetical protein